MRLEITRKADIAVRAILELARIGERTKASALAERIESSSGFLTQALTPLVGLGIIASEPGPTGGYSIRADLNDVSLKEVIEAIEGPTDSGQCVLEVRACSSTQPCVMHEPWSRARTQMLKELENTSLASLLKNTDRNVENTSTGMGVLS